MATIDRLTGSEVLDSRGRPTVRAHCALASGAAGSASVPAGASTGAHEARELRDGDPARYGGLGCRRAVAGIEGEINAALAGRALPNQRALDRALIELDGTPDKGRLGANALLAVSLAFARAVAAEAGAPLYRHLRPMIAQTPLSTLPRPTVNLFSGGKHAGGQVPIQDVLVVPTTRSVDGALAAVYAVYQAATKLVAERYEARALVADEGGLAPPFPSVEAMLDDAVAAIETAGFMPGRDVAVAVDVAASHLAARDRYDFGDGPIETEATIARLAGWVERYPIVSVEDGLAEDDWHGWPVLRRRFAGRVWTLGDDLLTTNPARIERAIAAGAADALLLKPNQIGTLSEAADALLLAREAGWRVVVSARSGETEDDWLTDLAVGWAADALKVGSIARSERGAKWNRLLAIETETGLPVVPWPEPSTAGR